MNERRFYYAAFLHHPNADLGQDLYELSPGVYIGSNQEAKPFLAFRETCYSNDIDIGPADAYTCYIIIETTASESMLDFTDPYALINRLTNILVINTEETLGESHIVSYGSDFQNAKYLHRIFEYRYANFEFLIHHNDRSLIDLALARDIQQTWHTSNKVWKSHLIHGRLINALTYFYYAWRSHYLEQVCLNLTIMLEVLFAPHSQSELTHQISYNVAHFLGGESTEMKETYRQIKTFYGIRSRIIHGDFPNENKLIDYVQNTFPVCAQILKRILLDPEIVDAFNDNEKRLELLDGYLFD